MRIVFVGGSRVARIAIRGFIDAGHEVIVIEENRDKIDELSDFLDCGFIHGDGTRLEILQEVDPSRTDAIICGTNNDHTNIISSLLARNLGFKKVITMIMNTDLQNICQSLCIDSTIFSARAISDYLQELIHGRDVFELTEAIQNKLTLFTFNVKSPTFVKDIQLPDKSRIVWLFRKDDFLLTDPEMKIEPEDKVVIATDRDRLEDLQKQFPK